MKPFCLLIYINCHLQTNTRMHCTHKLAHNPSTPPYTECTKLHKQQKKKKQAVHCNACTTDADKHTHKTHPHTLTPWGKCSVLWACISFLFHACTFTPINGKFLTHILSSTHNPGPVQGAIGTCAEPISQITFPAATSEWFSIRPYTGRKSQDPRASIPLTCFCLLSKHLYQFSFEEKKKEKKKVKWAKEYPFAHMRYVI